MPSRMEKYYQGTSEVKKRTNKNEDLYRTIYDEGEYTNVEGISIIEKNERIDIDKIRELIGHNEVKKPKIEVTTPEIQIYQEQEFEKNYDIRDILDKAKNERPEKEKLFSNTQYDILKGINIDENIPTSTLGEDDLKSMIEAITSNSKTGYTADLLDDLKSIHDPNMQEEIEKEMHDKQANEVEFDKSFYTSSLGFTNNDFEDLKEMKNSLKTNNILTKILLFILLVVIVTSVIFLVYHFMK